MKKKFLAFIVLLITVLGGTSVSAGPASPVQPPIPTRSVICVSSSEADCAAYDFECPELAQY